MIIVSHWIQCKVLKGLFAISGTTDAKLLASCSCGLRALVLGCLLLAPSIRPATAAPDDSVRNFVERVNEASTDLLLSEENAAERCRSTRLGFRCLGDGAIRPRQSMGPSNERRARGLLGRVRGRDRRPAYLRRMRDYRGAVMRFVGTRPPSGGDRMAASRLSLPDAEQTWIWRLRPAGQSWRIVDVAIDGAAF